MSHGRRRNSTDPGSQLAVYQTLFQQMADAVLVCAWGEGGKPGAVVEANAAAERLWGRSTEEMAETLPEDLLEGNQWPEPVEMMARRGEERVPVTVQAVPFEVAGEPRVMLICRDLSEQKRTEQSLRESDERLRAVLRQTPVLLFHQDRDLRYTRVDAPSVGQKTRQVLGLRDVDLVERSSDAEQLDRIKQRVLRTGEPLRDIVSLQVSGHERHFMLSLEPLRNQEGAVTGVAGVSLEVTAQERALAETRFLKSAFKDNQNARALEAERRAERLRALTSEMTQTQQMERRRIARMLHDHLQQMLVAAKMHVSLLRKDETEEEVDQVLTLLDQTIQVSRRLTVELSPPILHDHTLGAALEWLAEWIHRENGLRVDFKAVGPEIPLPEGLRVLLFQTVRELLVNVVRHAAAERALMTLRRSDGDLHIIIEDHGSGFDPEKLEAGVEHRQGMGLFSIRERMDLLGGKLKIHSRPGQGTRVILHIPSQVQQALAWGEP